MPEVLLTLRQFIDSGGPVLWGILVVTVAMWTMIIERCWYHLLVFPGDLTAMRSKREGLSCSDRRLARMILTKDVSELRERLQRFLPAIGTLIALCPLLGLLGTVTGMIHVFDTIGFSGTGNPRAMATGVSMATIPTMAGLVAALSGFLLSQRLQRSAVARTRLAAERLNADMAGGTEAQSPHSTI